MAMSTSTAPGFIFFTIAFVTSFGAFAPGIKTEPITRSASNTARSISKVLLAIVFSLPA
jgi:hypothetical protein